MATDLDRRKNRVFISLGSNLGNKRANLEEAAVLLEKKAGEIKASSSFYETESWGNEQLPNFYNQVICLQTSKSAAELMQILLGIEDLMGRERADGSSYTSRSMDLDIIYFNKDVISEKTLKIPHPRMHQRNFVLLPLAEIAPTFIHPVFGKSSSELLAQSPDRLSCKRTI
mgnify:CR=1 FL=1